MTPILSGHTTPVMVAYMITPFSDGGADRQLLELLRRIDRRRFEPVLYLSEAGGHIEQELATLDVPTIDVGQWGSNERAVWRMVGELRRVQPQVIHSWMFVANCWARLAGRAAGVPVIVTSDRGMDTDLDLHYRAIDVALSPLSTHHVVPARRVAEKVHRSRLVPRAKISVIYNGVDLEKYGARIDRGEARRQLDLPIDGQVVGMVASFIALKRWDVWLETIGELARKQRLTAIAVGDGEVRAAMEQRAAALGLSDTVRFYGVRADIPEVMAAIDVFTLTSDVEGTPNVVLQAMAARRPVVATDVGGIPEIMIDGETGFLVPPRNPRVMAERVASLLDDPARAEQLGKAGRHHAEANFSFPSCVSNTMALYDRLLQRRVRTASVEVGA
jgi:glycosyltransferase involved in cell wall biosynthesis